MSHLTRLTFCALVASIGFTTDALLTPKTYGDWDSAGSNPFAKTFAVSVQEPIRSADGGCYQMVNVAGHSIFDELEFKCDTELDLIEATDTTLIVGERYFTDTPKTLMVVNEDLSCMERTYDFSGEEVNVDGKKMSAEECLGIRKKMKAELTKITNAPGKSDDIKKVTSKIEQIFSDLNKSTSTNDSVKLDNDKANKDSSNDKKDSPTTTNVKVGSKLGTDKTKLENIPEDSSFNNEVFNEDADIEQEYSIEISSPFLNRKGILVKNVMIESPMYTDIIELPNAAKSDVITFGDTMVVGDTIYSNKPDQLVVVTGLRSCSLRKYGADKSIKISQLSTRECLQAQQEIRKVAAQSVDYVGGTGSSLGDQMGQLGNQLGSRFGNVISGVLDVGTSLGSSIGDQIINRPSLLGSLLTPNQQPQKQQHQEQNANIPFGMFNSLRSEIPNPLTSLFGDSSSNSIISQGNNRRIGGNSVSLSFGGTGDPSRTRQTSDNSLREPGNRVGQYDLFGLLNPLAWRR